MQRKWFEPLRVCLVGALMLGSFSTTHAVADGQRFAAELLAQWSEVDENVVFSPYSISAALAMTASGARGESAKQIVQVLLPGTTKDSIADHFAGVERRLESARADSEHLALAVANSIWPQDSFPLHPEFVDTIRNEFRGELTPVDYINATEAARVAINDWVAQRTHDRIEDLIAPGILSPATRLTLVNAVYFKGLWAEPFDPLRTVEAPFHQGPDQHPMAKFMRRQDKMRYAHVDGVEILELPYAGRRFSMLVLLPAPDMKPSELAEPWRSAGLDRWIASLEERDVDLWLPRFKCEWMTECTPTLQRMGIHNIFDAARVDLSGIAGRPGDLVVSAVVHKAFIEVVESGTEAAAATGVAMRLTAIVEPRPPVVFRVDRPFGFLIRENRFGTVLFAGMVVNPRSP